MGFVDQIHSIRSRSSFSANDITVWVIDLFEDVYDISPSEGVQTEVYIRQEDVRGRADIVVQTGMGIETKSNLNDEREKAETQVHNILTKLEQQGYSSPIGIATDGVDWSFYIKVNDGIYEYYDFEVTQSMSEEELADNLWDGLTPLRQETNRPDPTADRIAETFRPQGPVFNEVISRFKSEAEYVLSEESVDITSKFIPWFEVFRYVYNNFEERCKGLSDEGGSYDDIVNQLTENEQLADEDDQVVTGAVELFLRHTYLAIMAKTLSATVTLGEEAVTSRQLSNPEDILTGTAVRENGVHISDPNDYFAWLEKGNNSDSVLESFLKPLRRFSNNYTDDIFRHVYEQVVDPETRHELGEFFTPRWMAEMMVRDTVENCEESVIDPACGSGTFLVFALREKIRLFDELDEDISTNAVNEMLDQVWGIDINPLSTVLARTNIYLALASVVEPRHYPDEIKPQVITADTFINPRFEESQRQLPNDKDLDQSLVNVPISSRINIPVLTRLSVNEAQQIIDQCGKYMKRGLDELPENALVEGPEKNYQRAIFRTMTDLRDEYGDSLWKFVLRNYGIPPLLSKNFDIVLGNPPWLSYREARAQVKDTMQQIADFNDINPPAHAKTSFNLAIAFFMTSMNFLKREGGKISFVLPLSVLNSASHTKFIELIISRDDYDIDAVYDLEDINPNPFPHTLPTAILTVKKTGESI